MIGYTTNPQTAWLTFGFDETVRLRERGVYSGRLQDAVENYLHATGGDQTGFETCGLILCAPCIAPLDLKNMACAVAALKLPPNVARQLYPAQRRLWNQREPGE